MTAIGILGLDTSHGEAFAEILSSTIESAECGEKGPEITAVWDSNAVRDDEYVDAFAADVGARRYDDPAAMVGAVDAAMVLTVDWDRHVSLALPFLNAGLPTLIDKPIAGTLKEIAHLEREAGDTPVYGGSAVPYHPAFRRLPNAARGRTLFVAGYNDFFYYRTHTVDAARRVVGADWTRVSPCSTDDVSTVRVTFADGTTAVLRFDGPTESGTFGALDVADRTRAVELQAGERTHREMYEAFLGEFLAVCRGTTAAPTNSVLDGARLLLGAETALETGRTITRTDPALADLDRPSAPFVADYEPYY